jgi:hypothetical protein
MDAKLPLTMSLWPAPMWATLAQASSTLSLQKVMKYMVQLGYGRTSNQSINA